MQEYCTRLGTNVFNSVPLTFHVKDSIEHISFQEFAEKCGTDVWIVKPGENSNRGCGIEVFKDLDKIKRKIAPNLGANRTYIIQKYIKNPLLINKRKFDIRTFALMTSINGHLQGYAYQEGYLRTSCKEFSLDNLGNKYVHLTNDAIQKKHDDYGRYENGNKLSYADFQKFLDTNHSVDFEEIIAP